MKIQYKEESEYGQDVLELIGRCVSLQDPEKEYTLGEIRDILREIHGMCSVIEARMMPCRTDRWTYLGVTE